MDLQAAYRSVSIRESEHTLTGLQWQFDGHSNATYLVDTKLPFGARKSPAIFNRVSKSVQRMMNRRGYRCVVMLDDFFVCGDSFSDCNKAYCELIGLLRSLGFRINWRKVVDPCQDLVFLGIRINTVSGLLSLDQEKTHELVNLLTHTLSVRRLSKHQLQSLTGKLSWASSVITWGRAHLWRFYHGVRQLLQKDHKMQVKHLHEDLVWWRNILASHSNRRHIWPVVRPEVSLSTDACRCGGN